MKRNVALLLLTAVLLFLFTGCGAEVPSGKKRDTVKIGVSAWDADGAYGILGRNDNEWDVCLSDLTDDCVTVSKDRNGDYVINNGIVDSYARIVRKDGNVTYSFAIRDGLKFSNGDPLEAKDFCAWILFLLSPAAREMGVRYSAPYILGAEEYSSGDSEVLAGLRLEGDTVTLTVAGEKDGERYAPSYFELRYFALRAVHAGYWFGEGWHVEDDGSGCRLIGAGGESLQADYASARLEKAAVYDENRVTCGPYVISSVEMTENGTTYGTAHLVINGDYPGDYFWHKPSIEKIDVINADYTDFAEKLENGEIDILGETVMDPDLIDSLKAWTEKSGDSLCFYERAGYGYIQFACDFGPAQWKEVREAVACLMDRETYARAFCGGYGKLNGTVANTSGAAYKNNEDKVNKIDICAYDPERAASLLDEAGFIYNESGEPFVPGEDSLRYRKVTPDEARYYEEYCVKSGGGMLMPAILLMAQDTSLGPTVPLICEYLSTGDFARAGVEIRMAEGLSFAEMFNYMYRDAAYDIPGDFETPRYSMFPLAYGYSDAVFDPTRELSTDAERPDWGYLNCARYIDPELEALAEQMVYGTAPGNSERYNELWLQFMEAYSGQMIRMPLYCNTCAYISPQWLHDFEVNPMWGAARAILYATL